MQKEGTSSTIADLKCGSRGHSLDTKARARGKTTKLRQRSHARGGSQNSVGLRVCENPSHR